MSIWRKILRALRVSVLSVFLVGVGLLYYWSQTADPRFYLFLHSTPGNLFTKVFGWDSAGVYYLDEDKLEAEMTDHELGVKQGIEKELQKATPSAQVTLTDGQQLVGHVVSEAPNYIQFKESYGDSGALSLRIRRDRIDKLEYLKGEIPQVSYRDIRFRIEFPELNIYKRSPYTIVTDEKFFRVESTVRTLQRLHAEFLISFQSLVRSAAAQDNIQVLFYSNEEQFRAYQKRYAPRMDTSAGFYSPWTDRFIVFNQNNSQQVRDYQGYLDSQADQYKANGQLYGGAHRIDKWKREAGKKMQNLAEHQTLQTVRHEGAHQLFFTYGIHSRHRIENEWLYEGLAVYCEGEQIGEKQANRIGMVKALRHSDAWIPLDELINHRSSRGFFEFGSAERVDLAYSEAWCLVFMLMQPSYRDNFYRYIRFLREEANFRSVMSKSRYQLLCEYLGLGEIEFNHAWLAYVQRM